jgi:hypothetical protein
MGLEFHFISRNGVHERRSSRNRELGTAAVATQPELSMSRRGTSSGFEALPRMDHSGTACRVRDKG